jgi:hypothetical protein
LFIKDKIASCAPCQGQHLKAELARRKKKRLESGPRPAKRQRGALGPRLEGSESSAAEDEDKDDKPASDLLLMYNSVRGYCFVINKLWAHQTLRGLYAVSRP